MEIRCDNCRKLLLKVSGDFTGKLEIVCPRCGKPKEHEGRAFNSVLTLHKATRRDVPPESLTR